MPGKILLRAFFALGFLCVLAAAAREDRQKGRIENYYIGSVLALGFLACVMGISPGLGARVEGLWAAGLPLCAAAVIWPGSLGGGDVKLSAACGFFLGLRGGPVFLAATFGAAGIWGGLLFLPGRKERGERLPLGPFFVIGAAAALGREFFGPAFC